MRCNNEDINNNKNLSKLVKNILEGVESILFDYHFLFNEDELKIIVDTRKELEYEDDIERISNIENKLKEYAFRTWQYEVEQGNSFIAWLKDGNIRANKEVVSATFGTTEYPFCGSELGIKYKVDMNAFIAACPKDAATVIESSDKKSAFTIEELPNDRVINSYNFATPIMTPKQVLDQSNNDYKTKYNEIILDGRYAKPIGIVCLNDVYSDIANLISSEYGIPVDTIKNDKIK